MGQLLVTIAGTAAFLSWLSAVVHGVLLLRHVAPPRTAMSLLTQGFRFFDASTFLPSGHALHRRFVASVAAFFVAVFLAVGAGMLASARGA